MVVVLEHRLELVKTYLLVVVVVILLELGRTNLGAILLTDYVEVL